MALNPRRTVLMVCDMQERFRSAIYGFDAVAATISRMVKTAQLLNMRVITTEQNPKALGATIGEVGLESIPSQLNMGVYPKTKFSMFTPEVIQALGWNGSSSDVDRVIIVGIESHVCVMQSALDALKLGKEAIVIADGVSSCNGQEVPIALDRLRARGVDVASSESVLFQLVGDAAEGHFKEFQKIIKTDLGTTKGTLSTLFGPLPGARL